MYGRAEAVTGDLVAELGMRPRVFLATKVWTSGKEQGIAQMRRSAERLRTEAIDLIQIHNLLDWRTHLATLRQMKAKGQVRYIGITHYTTSSLPELARILDSEPGIDFVQFGYSLATRDAETKLLPVAASRGVATIVNQPFETGDMFRRVRGKPVPEWAADFDCTTWAQLFLKYILAEPAVTAVAGVNSGNNNFLDRAAQSLGTISGSVIQDFNGNGRVDVPPDVPLPGVQVLFAFLLIVPFSNGWHQVTEVQRYVYFVAFICAAIASALVIPS